MKTPFEFYHENPFERKDEFRVVGASTMEKVDLFALLIKNFIAFVYYETNYHGCIENRFEDGYELVPSQADLAKIYSSGKLKVKYKDSVNCSPIFIFFKYEITNLSSDENPDILSYLIYLSNYYTVFQRIDILVDLKNDESAGNNFLTYLSSYNLIFPHLNIMQVGENLENYFIAVCKGLSISYINYFDETIFLKEDYNKELHEVYFAMKFDLLDEGEQVQLVKYSMRWLTQRFKSFAISHDMQYSIGETEGSFLFEPFLQKFDDYFSFGSSKTEEKDYPKHIFSSWEAYHLFDTIAQGLTIKVSLSYVYRLLEEKRLIVAKDTPFRIWYNEQSYPLKLSTATETLANSKSTEREQFVAIVAKSIGVSI